MLNRLRTSPLIQKSVAAFDQLPTRDQRALQVLGIAVFLFIMIFGVWRPAHQFHLRGARDLAQAQDLVAWMHAHEADARQLAKNGEQGGPSVVDSRSLLTTVTTSAQKSGLVLQRFEPSGERGMRVWLQDVPFTSLAAWLEQLDRQYGIKVDQASIDRGENPGLITARLTLKI